MLFHLFLLHFILTYIADGYVIGDQHILTFDGKLIEFKAECEYVLVADMVGREWAVTISYDESRKKKFIIYADGEEVHLSSDFMVIYISKFIFLYTSFIVFSCTFCFRS